MNYHIYYREELTHDEITILADLCFNEICKHLLISLLAYPDLAQFVNDELYTLIEANTARKNVDQIRMGAREKSYSKKDPPSLYEDAARVLADGVCTTYALETKQGHEIEYARLVRYFAGMFTARFSRKWLGRKLERET